MPALRNACTPRIRRLGIPFAFSTLTYWVLSSSIIDERTTIDRRPTAGSARQTAGRTRFVYHGPTPVSNHCSFTVNRMISTSPRKNCGIDSPTSESVVSTRSSGPPGLRAGDHAERDAEHDRDQHPDGDELERARQVVEHDDERRLTAHVGALAEVEPHQVAEEGDELRGSGSSRPSASRVASRCSSVAESGSMNFTGSPMNRVTTNTKTVTPKMTTSPCTSRRAM